MEMSLVATFKQTRLLTFVVCLVGFCLASGCSSNETPVGSVSGTLSIDGKACGNCQIEIVGNESRLSVSAMVNEMGEFALDEIPFGEYGIAVRQEAQRHNAGNIAFDERIPKKYRSTKTSGFSLSITSIVPVELPLEMRSE